MKTFEIAMIMGICGATAVFVSVLFGWPTWVLFIAWVSYYLFGASLKNALTSLLQITLGLTLGILIQTFGYLFTGLIGSAGFPVAVFILIGSLAYISRISILSNIPGWFMGLIIFFGVHPKIELLPLISLMAPIIAGFAFAMINYVAVMAVTGKQNAHHS